MARMTFTGIQLAAPRWAGEYRDADSLLPGGVAIDTTGFTADAYGHITIPSGTLVGQTAAQHASGAPYHKAVDTDDVVYLVAFDVINAERSPLATLYKHTELIKEKYVPAVLDGSISATLLTKLRAAYETQPGFN